MEVVALVDQRRDGLVVKVGPVSLCTEQGSLIVSSQAVGGLRRCSSTVEVSRQPFAVAVEHSLFIGLFALCELFLSSGASSLCILETLPSSASSVWSADKYTYADLQTHI